MRKTGSVPNPYELPLHKDGSGTPMPGYNGTTGLTRRSSAIDPTKKTLVLVTVGQSNLQNIAPTNFIPTNEAKIDNFNIHDTALYAIGPAGLLGCSSTSLGAPYGNGNVAGRIADTLITNAKFDRVILVPIAIGGTDIRFWAPGLSDSPTGGPSPLSDLSSRFPIALRMLAARGITPSTPGVTFAAVWGQGEAQIASPLTQAAYQTYLTSYMDFVDAAGFAGGRWFIMQQTWNGGATSAPVRAAQLAVCTGGTRFTGGDADALNSSNRLADNIHFSDAGMAVYASLIVSKMALSGAPF